MAICPPAIAHPAVVRAVVAARRHIAVGDVTRGDRACIEPRIAHQRRLVFATHSRRLLIGDTRRLVARRHRRYALRAPRLESWTRDAGSLRRRNDTTIA